MAIFTHDTGVNLGLRLASEHLIKTAQDYEQMADQVREHTSPKYSLFQTADRAREAAYRAQALLLRGQAAAILEIRT